MRYYWLILGIWLFLKIDIKAVEEMAATIFFVNTSKSEIRSVKIAYDSELSSGSKEMEHNFRGQPKRLLQKFGQEVRVLKIIVTYETGGQVEYPINVSCKREDQINFVLDDSLKWKIIKQPKD